MFIRRVTDDALAQYAYVIGCQRTGEAIVIDPERDIDRYLEIAAAEGLKIVAAAETHIHADFLSGARELAEKVGATLYLSNEGGDDWRSFWAIASDYDVHLLHDGDTFNVGKIEFRVVHSPGHTPEHISFVVTDGGRTSEEPVGILSGDFVFVGDLGRPDLLETAAGQVGVMDEAAETLYESVPRFLELPDFVQVWPAHGAGSACGKALGAVPMSTVGYEKRFSPALAAQGLGKTQFVDWILDGQPEPPLYFGRMKALNRDGVPVLGELPDPEHVSLDAMFEAAAEGAVIVDTRTDRGAFIAGHPEGAIYAPLNKSFPTVVGSLVSPEDTIYLIIDRADVEEAVRMLIRIGYDNIGGFATPRDIEGDDRLRSMMAIDFATLEERLGEPGLVVLDVRGAGDFEIAHLPGAGNIAHTRLADRYDELPEEGTIAVHCESGARASAAASYLAAQGRDVLLIDDTFSKYIVDARDRLAPVEA